MKVREIITESISYDDAEKIISKFLTFVKNHLALDKLPKINLIKDSEYSVEYRSFGGYSPSEKSINVMISNRHIQDILRTISHELVHYNQDINGKLNMDSGKDGSPQENEANARAAVAMRQWGKLHPNLFKQSAVE